jgi:hypothetical protein
MLEGYTLQDLATLCQVNSRSGKGVLTLGLAGKEGGLSFDVQKILADIAVLRPYHGYHTVRYFFNSPGCSKPYLNEVVLFRGLGDRYDCIGLLDFSMVRQNRKIPV